MGYANALLTGASSGIGRKLALALARRGTHVVAAARRRDLLDALVQEIGAAGGSAEALTLDVADADATHDAVRALDQRLGIDLLVANAGVNDETPGGSIEWPRVHRVLSVNLVGAAATICGALPGMVARGRGHVVGISSLASFNGVPRWAAYSASKAGLNQLLDSLRMDLHGSGVDVTTVCPGFIRTEMTASFAGPMPGLMDADEAVERILRAIDQRRAVSAFPAPLSTTARLGQVLPRAWVRAVIRGVMGRGGGGADRGGPG